MFCILWREVNHLAFSIQEISKSSMLRGLNSVGPFIRESSCRLSFKLVIDSTVYSVMLIDDISTNNHVILVKRDK